MRSARTGTLARPFFFARTPSVKEVGRVCWPSRNAGFPMNDVATAKEAYSNKIELKFETVHAGKKKLEVVKIGQTVFDCSWSEGY